MINACIRYSLQKVSLLRVTECTFSGSHAPPTRPGQPRPCAALQWLHPVLEVRKPPKLPWRGRDREPKGLHKPGPGLFLGCKYRGAQGPLERQTSRPPVTCHSFFCHSFHLDPFSDACSRHATVVRYHPFLIHSLGGASPLLSPFTLNSLFSCPAVLLSFIPHLRYPIMVATLVRWVVVFTSLAGALGAAPPRKTRDRESVRNVAIIGRFKDNFFS